MSVSSPKVTVSVVLYHGDLDWAVRAIGSFARQRPLVPRIRVLCNDDDGTQAAALASRLDAAGLGTAASVTSSTTNLGFCTGHNRVLAEEFAGGADAVLVANADLMLESDALAALASRAHSLGGDALVGPVLTLADDCGDDEGVLDTTGIVWSASGRHFDGQQGELGSRAPTQAREVAGISGACLYVPRQAHDRVVQACGEFFDELFIAYREDAELGYRAGLLGVASWVEPAARGRHARGLRGTRRSGTPWVNQLGVQNRFLTAFKYGRRRPGKGARPWLRDLVVVASVLAHERSSLPGLRRAVGLRSLARAKGRRVLAVADEQAATHQGLPLLIGSQGRGRDAR